MNKFIAVGRLTHDPEVRYTQGTQPTAVAKYRLAIDRKVKKEGEQSADFVSCVAFGKSAEFVEKYLRRGMKIAIVARVQTGSYKDKNGNTVYTTDFVIEEQEFCESKNTQPKPQPAPAMTCGVNDGWVNIPDGVDDEGLPFN